MSSKRKRCINELKVGLRPLMMKEIKSSSSSGFPTVASSSAQALGA
jgi:hypothetical protein